MSSSINTNLLSLSIQQSLRKSEYKINKAMTRIASGQRINSAQDDPAGMAISQRFSAQINGINVASRNASDGISLSQTAEGGMQEISDILLTMRDLAVQSSNGTLTSNDRDTLQLTFTSLTEEITRTIESTQYNGLSVLANDDTLHFQVGAEASSANRITLETKDLRTADGLGDLITNSISVSGTTAASAQAAISAIDQAIDSISNERGRHGSNIRRIEHTINNLNQSKENMLAAKSRLTDTDYAAEISELIKWQIVQQASIAMLAQAHQHQKQLLQLLLR